MGNRKKNKLINIDNWVSDPININRVLMPNNMIMSYDQTLNPIKISDDYIISERVNDMRRAAEVHRQARRYLQKNLKVGMKYIDVCQMVENKVIDTFGRNDLVAGMGFPVGFSVNNITAHDSANPGDERVVEYNDVIKIDFGTHYNGNIIDSAFTAAFNPKYKPLLDSTKDATWAGIKLMGPDALIQDISTEILEVIESYEIELDGNIYPIRSVTNLGGHTIEPYIIHAGKLVLCGPNKMVDQNWRMNVGECYAIETFASTGKGNVVNDYNSLCNHYMKNKNHQKVNFKLNTTKKLYSFITKTRKTLPFCTRWLEQDFGTNYQLALKELNENNVVTSYPPLIDKIGTYTSQLEHTIYMHEFGKEVLSTGDDY